MLGIQIQSQSIQWPGWQQLLQFVQILWFYNIALKTPYYFILKWKPWSQLFTVLTRLCFTQVINGTRRFVNAILLNKNFNPCLNNDVGSIYLLTVVLLVFLPVWNKLRNNCYRLLNKTVYIPVFENCCTMAGTVLNMDRLSASFTNDVIEITT